MRELVIATFNPGKCAEMAAILSRSLRNTRLLTLKDFPGASEPEETGSTYAENAMIKALAAAKATHLPSLADDAGLEIDALSGAPGVYSKRFAGEELPFAAKMSKIIELLQGIPIERRTARFSCFVALAQPETSPRLFNASCDGLIAESISGEGGFGYDAIFFLPEHQRTMAQLTAEEKNRISHRGRVLADFSASWNQLDT